METFKPQLKAKIQKLALPSAISLKLNVIQINYHRENWIFGRNIHQPLDSIREAVNDQVVRTYNFLTKNGD